MSMMWLHMQHLAAVFQWGCDHMTAHRLDLNHHKEHISSIFLSLYCDRPEGVHLRGRDAKFILAARLMRISSNLAVYSSRYYCTAYALTGNNV
jgi:hypothetical protein